MQFVGSSSLPEIEDADRLLAKGLTRSVCLVDPDNAASFTFYGWEYFSVDDCRTNSQGFQLGNISWQIPRIATILRFNYN